MLNCWILSFNLIRVFLLFDYSRCGIGSYSDVNKTRNVFRRSCCARSKLKRVYYICNDNLCLHNLTSIFSRYRTLWLIRKISQWLAVTPRLTRRACCADRSSYTPASTHPRSGSAASSLEQGAGGHALGAQGGSGLSPRQAHRWLGSK